MHLVGALFDLAKQSMRLNLISIVYHLNRGFSVWGGFFWSKIYVYFAGLVKMLVKAN
jgi:hypothetical protein